MTTATYPFDPTGSNPLNRIVNEQQVITSTNFRNYHFFIPAAAPFFADTFSMTFLNTDGSVRTMVEGRDYYLTHFFISASRACAKPIYGSVTFLDTDTAGVARITYQTVGGDWVIDDQTIAEILANNLHNPRTTSWEQIVDMPVMFPVIDHEWNLVDMVGAKEVVESMDSIRDAILTANDGGLPAHVADKNNPHAVTATQVGLGLVQNFPIASFEQATAGTINTAYMTPLRVSQAITALGNASVAAHAARTDNPHATTKSQVGLGSVQNYGVATNADATAGVATNLYMTPAATKAALDVVSAVINSHISNQLNPHNVTKDQLVLGNVQNYPVATALEAQQGTASDRYMTPLRVKQAIDALSGGSIQAHVSDFNNPHNTTKAQVGLALVDNYATASTTDAQNNTINNKFMTPQATYAAINGFVLQAFTDHVNAPNPHNTTKATVGLGNVDNYATATSGDAQVGTATDKFMTPATTAIMVQAGVDVHANRQDNPHAVTKAQVGLSNVSNYATATDAEAQAGVSSTTFMTPRGVALYFSNGAGATITSHVNNTNNPHNVTATQVGLGNVQNYGVASDTEAVDGSITNKYITPRGLFLGAQAAATPLVQAHSNRTDNPHATTAAQVGAYSKTEADALLLAKLDANGTAVNSDKVGGADLATILGTTATLATTTVNNAIAPITAAQTEQKFNRSYTTHPTATSLWLKLATLAKTPSPTTGSVQADELPNAVCDLHLLISGGEAPTSDMGGLYYLHMSIHSPTNPQAQPISVTLKQLSDNPNPDLQLGYTWDGTTQTATIYVKVQASSNPVTTTNLNRGGIVLTAEDRIAVEPTGISYIPLASLTSDASSLGGVPASGYVLKSDFDALQLQHDTLQSDFTAYKVQVADKFQELADQIAAS